MAKVDLETLMLYSTDNNERHAVAKMVYNVVGEVTDEERAKWDRVFVQITATFRSQTTAAAGTKELKQWCIDNIENPWFFDYAGEYAMFEFKEPEDAMFFKLTWMG